MNDINKIFFFEICHFVGELLSIIHVHCFVRFLIPENRDEFFTNAQRTRIVSVYVLLLWIIENIKDYCCVDNK